MEQYAEKGKGVHVKSHRKEYLSKNKFINEVLKVKLVVDEIDVVMIHRESHIPMFQLIAQSICNEFVMGEN